MTLKAYLALKGWTVAQAAAQFDCPHETMRKWVNGERMPRPATMMRIEQWSEGQVSPSDWYAAAASCEQNRNIGLSAERRTEAEAA